MSHPTVVQFDKAKFSPEPSERAEVGRNLISNMTAFHDMGGLHTYHLPNAVVEYQYYSNLILQEINSE
jgi:hypothetical protein